MTEYPFGRFMIASLVGGAVGALLVFVLSGSERVGNGHEIDPFDQNRSKSPPQVLLSDSGRDQSSEIEQRLRHVERQVFEAEEPEVPLRGGAQSADGSRSVEAPAEEQTPEEEDEAVREKWRGHIAEFEADPVDVQWARQASETLGVDYASALTEFGGVVDSVECRSSRCRLQLVFGSPSSVKDGSMAALYRVNDDYNCTRHLSIDRTQNASTLIVDCSDE